MTITIMTGTLRGESRAVAGTDNLFESCGGKTETAAAVAALRALMREVRLLRPGLFTQGDDEAYTYVDAMRVLGAV